MRLAVCSDLVEKQGNGSDSRGAGVCEFVFSYSASEMDIMVFMMLKC